MTKYLSIIALILIVALNSFGQDTIVVKRVYGKVYDPLNKRSIAYTHVINQKSSAGTISDTTGHFSLYGRLGDTLFISAMGYQFDVISVTEEMFDTSYLREIRLAPRAYMLPEVIIHELATYDQFRDRFMDTKVVDNTYHIPGLPRIQARAVPRLYDENYLKNPMFALMSPISFFYYNFSRREKNKRKYYELVMEDNKRKSALMKVDKATIMDLTGLNERQLLMFIEYSGLNGAILSNMSDYDLLMLIRREMKSFKRVYGID